MIKKIIFLSLLLAGPAAFADTDCSKNLDACSAGTKKLSPFVAASLRESTPPHIEAPARKASPAAVASSSAAVPAVAADLPRETGGKLSSPAWLFLVIAGFTGLYFYLREGTKKRKRK